MRSLVLILTLTVIVGILGWHYIDRSIDLAVVEAQCTNFEPTTDPRASVSLTVEDTGYNDAVQTVYGVNLYQNAAVRLQQAVL